MTRRRKNTGRRTLAKLPAELRKFLDERWHIDDTPHGTVEPAIDDAWHRRGFEARLNSLRRRDRAFDRESRERQDSFYEDLYDSWRGDYPDDYPDEWSHDDLVDSTEDAPKHYARMHDAVVAGIRAALGESPKQLVRFDVPLRVVVPDLTVVNDEVLAFLARHPNYIHELHHRAFEQMLAAVFRSLGYTTELGPGTGDDGIDLRLEKASEVGPFITLVQAKRWRQRPVGLEVCSALYGSVERHRASKGVVATTSRFLPSARRFADSIAPRLLLAGPEDITAWLRDAAQRKSKPNK